MPITSITHPTAKRLLLSFFLLLLLLPGLQARLHWLPEPELGGAFTMAPHPDLTWSGLYDSSYQPALESYVEDRLGFRSFLIRSRNQLQFSLFGITHSEGIVAGKNGVLFMPNYIQAYLGEDTMDPADLQFRVRRLRAVQQDLAKCGISFLFVLAPNKARFEPENLPAHAPPAATNNYNLFVRNMQADSVNLLDCVALFARWKSTAPYPLFPRGGIHWSGYGATRVADTLLRRLESLGGFRLPSYREVGRPTVVRNSDSLRSTDNDLNQTLNLLLRQETTPLAYRHLRFDPPQPGQTRPPLLLVGDSFSWALMQFAPYIQREFAPESRFWFYNRTVHLPDSVYHPLGESNVLNFRHEVESRRVVVLLMTEHNLAQHEFGFTDQVYRLYHPLTEADNQAINALADKLKANASWEEASKDPEQLNQRLHERAQQQYERQQMEELAHTAVKR